MIDKVIGSGNRGLREPHPTHYRPQYGDKGGNTKQLLLDKGKKDDKSFLPCQGLNPSPRTETRSAEQEPCYFPHTLQLLIKDLKEAFILRAPRR